MLNAWDVSVGLDTFLPHKLSVSVTPVPPELLSINLKYPFIIYPRLAVIREFIAVKYVGYVVSNADK